MRLLASDTNRPTGRFCFLGMRKVRRWPCCVRAGSRAFRNVSSLQRPTESNRTTVVRFIRPQPVLETVHSGPIHCQETVWKSRNLCPTSMTFPAAFRLAIGVGAPNRNAAKPPKGLTS